MPKAVLRSVAVFLCLGLITPATLPVPSESSPQNFASVRPSSALRQTLFQREALAAVVLGASPNRILTRFSTWLEQGRSDSSGSGAEVLSVLFPITFASPDFATGDVSLVWTLSAAVLGMAAFKLSATNVAHWRFDKKMRAIDQRLLQFRGRHVPVVAPVGPPVENTAAAGLAPADPGNLSKVRQARLVYSIQIKPFGPAEDTHNRGWTGNFSGRQGNDRDGIRDLLREPGVPLPHLRRGISGSEGAYSARPPVQIDFGKGQEGVVIPEPVKQRIRELLTASGASPHFFVQASGHRADFHPNPGAIAFLFLPVRTINNVAVVEGQVRSVISQLQESETPTEPAQIFEVGDRVIDWQGKAGIVAVIHGDGTIGLEGQSFQRHQPKRLKKVDPRNGFLQFPLFLINTVVLSAAAAIAPAMTTSIALTVSGIVLGLIAIHLYPKSPVLLLRSA